METAAERYREQVKICAAPDYLSRAQVKRHNTAVDAMRRIVAEAGEADSLVPLLDDESCSRWLAYQLLELTKPSNETRIRCLSIIREIADAPDGSGIGAQVWLKQHRIPTNGQSP